jgi:hypothetical protein
LRAARIAGVVAWLAVAGAACTTASVYRGPIARFQTAVDATADVLRPYLVEFNALVVKANLYDKVSLEREWGTQDLKAGIPERELHVRVRAMSALQSYAAALATVADARPDEELAAAARTLGDDVNALAETFAEVKGKRTSNGGTGDTAARAAKLDLGAPLSSLVTLVGTFAVGRARRTAIEEGILAAQAPVTALIDLLRADVRTLTQVDDALYGAIRTGLVGLHQAARKDATPRETLDLIDALVRESARIDTLRAIQVDGLLAEMKGAHAALASYVRSPKRPEDLADLAARIDVFTAHVRLVREAIDSLRPPRP